MVAHLADHNDPVDGFKLEIFFDNTQPFHGTKVDPVSC